MKKHATALLLCLSGSLGMAQYTEQSKPVRCFSLDVALAALQDTWNERPVWSGSGAGSNFALFMNPNTGSWTLLEFGKDVACVIGSGNNSKSSKSGPRI